MLLNGQASVGPRRADTGTRRKKRHRMEQGSNSSMNAVPCCLPSRNAFLSSCAIHASSRGCTAAESSLKAIQSATQGTTNSKANAGLGNTMSMSMCCVLVTERAGNEQGTPQRRAADRGGQQHAAASRRRPRGPAARRSRTPRRRPRQYTSSTVRWMFGMGDARQMGMTLAVICGRAARRQRCGRNRERGQQRRPSYAGAPFGARHFAQLGLRRRGARRSAAHRADVGRGGPTHGGRAPDANRTRVLVSAVRSSGSARNLVGVGTHDPKDAKT
eukprot:gene22968-biopygen1225